MAQKRSKKLIIGPKRKLQFPCNENKDIQSLVIASKQARIVSSHINIPRRLLERGKK